MSRYRSLAISLFVALVPVVFLWLYSDSPPYGYPDDEISNGYWGTLIDIAHKWRELDFSFWDKGLYGGTSFFTIGTYPLLDPTNALSFILDDDRYYLWNLIEPYFFGVFFMHVLLWRQYKLSFFISVFGALLYMGAILWRHTGLTGQPFFLWGPALFPLIVLAVERYIPKDIYLSAALVGAVLALMFAVGGVVQLPQHIIWWSIFLFLYLLSGSQFKQIPRVLLRWLGCVSILILLVVGLFGIQFIPTFEYVNKDSIFWTARVSNYPINSFPLWGSIPTYTAVDNLSLSLSELIDRAVTSPTGVSGYPIVALVFGIILIAITNFRPVIERFRAFSNLPRIWLATILYLVLPTVAVVVVNWLPFLRGTLSVFGSFTFYYAVHLLDFCVVLTLCVFLHNDKLILGSISASKRYLFFISISIAAILFYLFLPLIVKTPVVSVLIEGQARNFIEQFKPAHIGSAIVSVLAGVMSLYFLLIRPKKQTLVFISMTGLILLGFMNFVNSYNWNDKGKFIDHNDRFCWSCPEHEYYRSSSGRYFWSLQDNTPAYMGDHYPLLYGLHSLEEFMGLDPKRFSFLREILITNSEMEHNISAPKYFPIDFTVVKKGESLNWQEFRLAIEGTRHDVYERVTKAERVFFSSKLDVVPNDAIFERVQSSLIGYNEIASLNIQDERNTWFVSESDIGNNFPRIETGMEDSGSSQPYYQDYISEQMDAIQFKAITPYSTYVLIPEMYQNGWRVEIDGKAADVFPINYVFLGFMLPRGEHNVEVRFVPPKVLSGAVVNTLAVLVLVIVCYRYKVSISNKRQGRKRWNWG